MSLAYLDAPKGVILFTGAFSVALLFASMDECCPQFQITYSTGAFRIVFLLYHWLNVLKVMRLLTGAFSVAFVFGCSKSCDVVLVMLFTGAFSTLLVTSPSTMERDSRRCYFLDFTKFHTKILRDIILYTK